VRPYLEEEKEEEKKREEEEEKEEEEQEEEKRERDSYSGIRGSRTTNRQGQKITSPNHNS
jgi:hypothetical protein